MVSNRFCWIVPLASCLSFFLHAYDCKEYSLYTQESVFESMTTYLRDLNPSPHGPTTCWWVEISPLVCLILSFCVKKIFKMLNKFTILISKIKREKPKKKEKKKEMKRKK